MSCAGCGFSAPGVASLAQHRRWCAALRSSLAAPRPDEGGGGLAALIGGDDDDELGGDGPGAEGGGGGAGDAAADVAAEGGDAAADYAAEDGDADAGTEFGGGGADDEAALSLAKMLTDLELPATADEVPCDEEAGLGAVEDVLPPHAAAPMPPSATLRAGSTALADLTTRAFLSKPGVAASVGLYGALLQVRVCVK